MARIRGGQLSHEDALAVGENDGGLHVEIREIAGPMNRVDQVFDSGALLGAEADWLAEARRQRAGLEVLRQVGFIEDDDGFLAGQFIPKTWDGSL